MNTLTLKGRLVIYVTFFIALLLTILPLPGWTIWLRPAWLPLVLIYWSISMPASIGIGTAWVLGILLDVLNGTLLGAHALALSIITYLSIKFYRQVRVFPLWQQAVTIAVFLTLYESLLLMVQGFINQLGYSWLAWLSIIISALLWPWLSIVMRDVRQRYMLH